MTWLGSAWAAARRQAGSIAARAGHTFWQALLAAVGVSWAASGLDVSQVTDVDTAKRFALGALVALAAAVASAVKTTVQAVLSDPGEYVGEHQADPGAAPQPPAAV